MLEIYIRERKTTYNSEKRVLTAIQKNPSEKANVGEEEEEAHFLFCYPFQTRIFPN